MIVASVGSPADIEQVTEYRHQARNHFYGQVGHHPRDGDQGNAAEVGSEHDDAAGHASQEIANAGNEADHAVDAKADIGAGNAKPGVEHAGEHVEVFIAK